MSSLTLLVNYVCILLYLLVGCGFDVYLICCIHGSWTSNTMVSYHFSSWKDRNCPLNFLLMNPLILEVSYFETKRYCIGYSWQLFAYIDAEFLQHRSRCSQSVQQHLHLGLLLSHSWPVPRQCGSERFSDCPTLCRHWSEWLSFSICKKTCSLPLNWSKRQLGFLQVDVCSNSAL